MELVAATYKNLAPLMLRGSVKYGVIPWGGLVEKFTGNTYTITVGICNIITAPILNGGKDDFGIGGNMYWWY